MKDLTISAGLCTGQRSLLYKRILFTQPQSGMRLEVYMPWIEKASVHLGKQREVLERGI